MGFANNIISRPVSIADVQQATGQSYTDLGSLINGTITKWARYKPVIYDPSVSGKYAPLTSADREHAYTITTAQDGVTRTVRHGITIPYSGDYNKIVEDATNNPGNFLSRPWGYDYPQGGQYKPYRLSDFEGFYTRAVGPVYIAMPTGANISIPNSGDGSKMRFSLLIDQAAGALWQAAYCLAFSDLLGAYTGYYLTIQMICTVGSGSSATHYRYAKSGPTVSSIINNHYIGQVEIDSSVLKSVFSGSPCLNAGAVWKCCIMLTSNSYAGTAADHSINSGTCMRLEYTNGADRKSYTVVITEWWQPINSITINVTVNKYANNRYYISNIAVVYNTSSTITAIAVQFIYGCPSGSISSTNDPQWVIKDSMAMQGATTKNFSNSDIQSPFFITTSEFPDGTKLGYVQVEFMKEYVNIGTTVNMTLNTVSTSQVFSNSVVL